MSRSGAYVGIAGMLAPLTLTLSEHSGTVGRYDQAVRYFERAVDECRRAGLRSDMVRRQLAWARVLTRGAMPPAFAATIPSPCATHGPRCREGDRPPRTR